ncbi:MAG: REP element-mobilizing transposase RayT [Candidatus Electronema aureum]|uniref:REP element-mobilizing transposase RayT n=1 Tax=Candidatus Electronema aureum TaxID=2005002 RepID=A0A521G3Z4_9BACT|nr:MAG: REP element-mobilizing transposase RayT [Candidatus Electronema aureum]
MQYNPDIHHRRSIRLQGYDYSQDGAYFITICVQGRECLFGDIAEGGMRMNEAGKMILQIWNELPQRFSNAEIDILAVMPNHLHGIIFLHRRGEPCVRPASHCISSLPSNTKGDHKDRPYGTLPDSIGRLVQAFKSITTNQYIHGVKKQGWRPFPGRLWQRNYWEHIICDETELEKTREYVQNNPAQWALDELNPFYAP